MASIELSVCLDCNTFGEHSNHHGVKKSISIRATHHMMTPALKAEASRRMLNVLIADLGAERMAQILSNYIVNNGLLDAKYGQ